MKFNQANQIAHLEKLAKQSMLNKAHMIEIKKSCIVAFMKVKKSLVVQCSDEFVNWKENRRW